MRFHMQKVSELIHRLPRRTSSVRSRVAVRKKAFAASLRRKPTAAYSELWLLLRGKQLGVRFRRRAVLYGWIVDFWCPSERLAIEIDYASDSMRTVEHKRRDEVLARYGILVHRFPVERIYHELPQVVREIRLKIKGDRPHETEG